MALQSAVSAGVLARVRDSSWRRKRLMILCYHGISIDDEHVWNPALYVSPERFRERLTRLRDGDYHVLPLAEAVRRMHAGTLPPRAVALTFDDGTHDFAVRALPILAEFGFPATVYLTTYYCRLQRPVFDPSFMYMLWKAGVPEVEGTGLVPGPGRVATAGYADRAAFMLRVRDYAAARGLSGEEKDSLLRVLCERTGADYNLLARQRLLHIMSPDEVAGLPRDLVDIQLHTHRHRTPREEEPYRKEIGENRSEIAALLGGESRPEHFCYPNGYFERRFLPWLRDENVVTATTCVPGIASPADDPLLLPRLVDTMNVPTLVFDSWLAGTAAWAPQRHTRPPQGA